MENEEMPEILSAQQVCARLGISRTTLHRRVKEGVLTPIPISGALKKAAALQFRREDVTRLLPGATTASGASLTNDGKPGRHYDPHGDKPTGDG